MVSTTNFPMPLGVPPGGIPDKTASHDVPRKVAATMSRTSGKHCDGEVAGSVHVPAFDYGIPARKSGPVNVHTGVLTAVVDDDKVGRTIGGRSDPTPKLALPATAPALPRETSTCRDAAGLPGTGSGERPPPRLHAGAGMFGKQFFDARPRHRPTKRCAPR